MIRGFIEYLLNNIEFILLLLLLMINFFKTRNNFKEVLKVLLNHKSVFDSSSKLVKTLEKNIAKFEKESTLIKNDIDEINKKLKVLSPNDLVLIKKKKDEIKKQRYAHKMRQKEIRDALRNNTRINEENE